MADIRQSTVIRDQFTRVEDPLSFGGKWSLVDSSFGTTLKDNGTSATTSHPTGQYGWSYWNVESYDGDDAECWACRVSTSGPTLANDAWLLAQPGGSGVADGYVFRVGTTTGGTYTELYRMDNIGVTQIAGDIFGPFIGHPTHCLIRRNGGDVEGWTSHDSGANWDLRVTASDSTYMTGLYAGLAIFGNSAGWSCFGGGPRVAGRQQIYRILQSPH